MQLGGSAGMKTWVHAFVLATVSGLSLPVGAILGIILSPVRDTVCAAWLAFGAGALLFAVTVELYGHSLHELEIGHSGIVDVIGMIAGAFAGALFYLAVNRWLEESMDAHDAPEEDMEQAEVGSDGQSLVGSLAPANETTPFHPRHHKAPVSTTLAEERRKFEHMALAQGGWSTREDSFARNTSFSRHASFSRNLSFAYSEGSFVSRGRTVAINALSGHGDSPTHKLHCGTGSIAETIPEVDEDVKQKGNRVAFALFLGLLADGVPEGILMGFLAAEGHLSEVLIVSLLVANFPEAFSSASLMAQGGVPYSKIVSMWTGLCLVVGTLAGASCYALQLYFPSYPSGDIPHSLRISVALVEGFTGGAMISCIAMVMLPEAFCRTAGSLGPLLASSGFLCTSGFLVAVTMKAFEHYYDMHT